MCRFLRAFITKFVISGSPRKAFESPREPSRHIKGGTASDTLDPNETKLNIDPEFPFDTAAVHGAGQRPHRGKKKLPKSPRSR